MMHAKEAAHYLITQDSREAEADEYALYVALGPTQSQDGRKLSRQFHSRCVLANASTSTNLQGHIQDRERHELHYCC